MIGAAERFRASLHRAGRPMALTSRTGASGPLLTATVMAHARHYKPTEVIGLIKAGDQRIRVSAIDLAAERAAGRYPGGDPRTGMTLDGKAVQGAEPLYDGSNLVGYVVWVR